MNDILTFKGVVNERIVPWKLLCSLKLVGRRDDDEFKLENYLPNFDRTSHVLIEIGNKLYLRCSFDFNRYDKKDFGLKIIDMVGVKKFQNGKLDIITFGNKGIQYDKIYQQEKFSSVFILPKGGETGDLYEAEGDDYKLTIDAIPFDKILLVCDRDNLITFIRHGLLEDNEKISIPYIQDAKTVYYEIYDTRAIVGYDVIDGKLILNGFYKFSNDMKKGSGFQIERICDDLYKCLVETMIRERKIFDSIVRPIFYVTKDDKIRLILDNDYEKCNKTQAEILEEYKPYFTKKIILDCIFDLDFTITPRDLKNSKELRKIINVGVEDKEYNIRELLKMVYETKKFWREDDDYGIVDDYDNYHAVYHKEIK